MSRITHNVHEVCGKEVIRVQAEIDRNIYDYFFRHVLAYSHGSRQAMITFFFQRLYEECLAEKIPCRWDEEFADKVVNMLNRLNFKASKPKKVKSNE